GAFRTRLRAGRTRRFHLLQRDIRDSDSESAAQCDLKRKLSESAVAEERQQLSGGESCLAYRGGRGPSSAAERSDFGGIQVRRHMHQCVCGRQKILRHRAVRCVPKIGLFGTESLATIGAPFALTACRAEKSGPGAVAGRPACDTLTYCFHTADAFVTECDRCARQLLQTANE